MGLNGNLIIAYMKSKSYWLDTFNLVGVEGVNNDGQLNKDVHDTWSDTILVITSAGQVIVEANATTEPGKFYTDNPMNSMGAARLAFGQHKDCWEFGYHNNRKNHPALVQTRPVKVHRDKNKDGARNNDKTFEGNFGINIHGTLDKHSSGSVGKFSAGCQVIRSWSLHLKMLETIRKNSKRTFTYTLIPGDELAKFAVDNKLQFKV